MIICVTGGREYQNQHHVYNTLTSLNQYETIDEIVHGGAQGVDSMAHRWAKRQGIQETIFWPNYRELHWKYAPIERNQRMANYLRHQIEQYPLEEIKVVAFPGGSGTKSMIDFAKNNGIVVLIKGEDTDV